MNRNDSQNIKAYLLPITIFIVLSVSIGFGLHTHTDEFILFNDLAFQHPNFVLNNFTAGFDGYTKIFFNSFEVSLPFLYTGNIQSFLFRPFYWAFPIEIAKFAYSFCSLAIIFLLFRNAFKLSISKLYVLVLFIPIYVTVLHDCGPVNISISIFLLTKIGFTYFYEAHKKSTFIFFTIGFFMLWAIGFYDKLFFIYLFPGLILFSLSSVPKNQLLSTKSVWLLFSCLAFFSFVYYYLSSDFRITLFHTANSQKYTAPLNQILGGGNDLKPLIRFIRFFPGSIVELGQLKEFVTDRLLVIHTLMNSFDFSYYFVRNLESPLFKAPKLVANISIDHLLFLIFLIPSIFFIAKNLVKSILFKQADSGRYSKSIFYFLSILSLMGTFLLIGKIRSPHHTLFIWIPLLGLILDNSFEFEKKKSFLIYYAFTFGLCTFNFFTTPPQKFIVDKYQKIISYTQRDNPKIQLVNFDTFNHFLTRRIDNPHGHIITYVDPRDSIQFTRLIRLSDSLKTPIIEVSGKYDWGYQQDLTFDQKMNLIKQYHRKIVMLNASSEIPIFLIKKP
jgi:hypothetical protein